MFKRFFGRDDETDELLSLLLGHKVVLVYAQSGAGKTSLLNAKIIPELEENGLHVLPVARVEGYLEMHGTSESPEDANDKEAKVGVQSSSSVIPYGFNPFMYNAIQYLLASEKSNQFEIHSMLSGVTTFSEFLEKKLW
jgi:hypothetical protein